MNKFQKSQLLLATALVGSVAGNAQAQVVFPSAELHSMGASSVATILPREMNCVGTAGVGTADASGNYTNILAAGATPFTDASGNALTKLNLKVGKNDGTASAVTAGNYAGADAAFNCAVKSVQPGFAGLYISTGSGGGKTAWKNISAGSFFTGASGKQFPTAYGTLWDHPHFVMSDSAISAGDKTTFESVGVQTAGKVAGKAIQIPLYVLPVAVVYNPVYGRKVDASGNAVNDASGNPIAYRFNVGAPQTFGTTAIGGLRLSKQVYCGIFNGYITNWNNAAITALNLKVVNKKTTAVSLMDASDSTTRWNADGVPIRLVGRADKSGTTDIFTRHLSQVCSGIMPGGANKYTAQAEALPYVKSGGADILQYTANAAYFPDGAFAPGATVGTTNSNTFAGSVDLISGAFWNGTAVLGTEALGKFTVADGSGKLESYVLAAADKASTSDATVLLNGKIGYVGADFAAPSGGKTLQSAALEVGQTNGTKKPLFAMPTAVNAQAAFGTKILPPEGDKGGKYTAAGNFKRSNPADWYDALYFGESTLGNPTVGYPITGTTQFVTGTCFAKPEDRNAVVLLLNTLLGNVKLDSTGAKVSTDTFTGVKAAKLGIRPAAGLAPLPKAWNVAITETFLTRSKQKASDGTLLSAANLYIQNGLPTKSGLAKIRAKTTLTSADLPTTVTETVKGKTVTMEAGPNSTCTIGSGL